ncbi:MAG: hypothetical protein WD076_04690 [Parvularculaceae bacterium]
MPYGVKRGVKSPGEFSTVDIFGLALAGSAGILAAIVTDYQQKGEGAAILTINQWVVSAARAFSLGDVPLWAVAIGMVVAGAAAVFYFQPITRQGAFAQGFGLLAVLMTAIPSNLGGMLVSSGVDELQGLEPIAMNGQTLEAKVYNATSVTHALAEGEEARVYKVQDTRGAAQYDVNLSINFANGVPRNIDGMIQQGSVRGRLHNADTKATYNLFRGGSMTRTANSINFSVGVPARSESATLWVRIEVEGYAIEEQSAIVKLGETSDWPINMQPSNMPLFIQRLGKSYWF